jgi:hypothetical protein
MRTALKHILVPIRAANYFEISTASELSPLFLAGDRTTWDIRNGFRQGG